MSRALPFASNAQPSKQDDSLLRAASAVVKTIKAFNQEKNGKALQQPQKQAYQGISLARGVYYLSAGGSWR